jgi:hypothetical protein
LVLFPIAAAITCGPPLADSVAGRFEEVSEAKLTLWLVPVLASTGADAPAVIELKIPLLFPLVTACDDVLPPPAPDPTAVAEAVPFNAWAEATDVDWAAKPVNPTLPEPAVAEA